jgi:hypothetical protein
MPCCNSPLLPHKLSITELLYCSKDALAAAATNTVVPRLAPVLSDPFFCHTLFLQTTVVAGRLFRPTFSIASLYHAHRAQPLRRVVKNDILITPTRSLQAFAAWWSLTQLHSSAFCTHRSNCLVWLAAGPTPHAATPHLGPYQSLLSPLSRIESYGSSVWYPPCGMLPL